MDDEYYQDEYLDSVKKVSSTCVINCTMMTVVVIVMWISMDLAISFIFS